MNSTAQRAELRNTLLHNGYRPLPLVDKGIRIKGWVKADITEEWLSRFERAGTYANTGLRCDNLLAFDVDVLDEKLADKLEALIEKRLGPTKFCRYGRFPKRLLLYRITDGSKPPKSGRTARYIDEGGEIACVELLCNRGRQFAAYGRHPSGVDYEWADDIGPHNAPYADLPAAEPEAALRVLKACDKLIQRAGLREKHASMQHELTGGTDNDLTPETRVQLNDGTELTWGELRGTLDKDGVFGNLVREDGEFGDSDAVHFMLAHGSGEPCAHDFARDVTHYESIAAPEVKHLLPDDPNSIATDPHSLFTNDAIEDLIENWAFVAADSTCRPLDAPARSVPLTGFRQRLMHKTMPDPNAPATNPNKRIPITQAWERSPHTKRADFAELRPDRPDDEIVREGSLEILNTYLPPDHPESGGDKRAFFDFMQHLIPREAERELFVDWLASKYAHPARRQHAMVMVTPAFGTGRGTLCQIIERLFGQEYVTEVGFDRLMGEGSQSQYNEFLAGSLIVTVGEALVENENRTKWRSRHMAYEHLKRMVSPEAQRMHVTRKYGRNSTERIFASLLIQSNHMDALAIEPGDRRVIVISNTETPLIEAGNLQERIHAWKLDPANIGALGRYLTERAERIAYDPEGIPPMTPAKEAMIESGQSDTERLFEIFQDEAAGDVCTASQWRAFAHAARMRYELDLPSDPERLEKALNAVLQKHARRPEIDNKNGQIKIGGTLVRPWIIRNIEHWQHGAGNTELREEVLKNGPPGGAVVEFKPKA